MPVWEDSQYPDCDAPRPYRAGVGRRRAARKHEEGVESAEDAYRKVLRLAAVRERCESELRTRLEGDGFDPATVGEALGRAMACGVIDDRRFAESFVRGRVSMGKGRQGIEAELRARGIEPDGLPGWPEEFGLGDEEAEAARALSSLEARPPASSRPHESAYRRLIGKGFSASVAATASRLWSEGLD